MRLVYLSEKNLKLFKQKFKKKKECASVQRENWFVKITILFYGWFNSCYTALKSLSSVTAQRECKHFYNAIEIAMSISVARFMGNLAENRRLLIAPVPWFTFHHK